MRTFLICLVPVLLWTAGCSRTTADAPATGQAYRVVWDARRPGEKTALSAVASPAVRVGAGEIRVRVGASQVEENRPQFPEFRARLSPTARRGVIELATRVSVLDAVRNKKGKVKVHKRFIGALLPIRPGETLGVSGPGDPVEVVVRLEAAGAR